MRRRSWADAGGRWARVSQRTRGFEDEIRPAVWNMVQSTYAKIGLILDHPSELDEYDVWNMFEDDGHFVAFQLGKTTPYGVKLGLVGSDGSRAGRAAVKAYVAEGFFEPGNYAEVSHRMQELAFEAGAPIVCAVYASEVLRKQVVPEPDGLRYRRVIKNVGEVVKVLIGRPRGVPVTSSAAPQCPLPLPRHAVAGQLAGLSIDRSAEAVFAHAASLVDL
jgi:hypothetical protein